MRLLLVAILLLCLGGFVMAQSRSDEISSAATSPLSERSGLELTTSIVEAKYCSKSSITLTLQLLYRNVGGSNLVLFKYGLAPYEHRISRSADAAAAKDYEKLITPMMGFSSLDLKAENVPSPDYFIILKPGEKYSPPNNIYIPVFLKREGEADCEPHVGSNCESGLPNGQHVIQVKVRTWPFRVNPERELQTRWRQFGDIWTEPVLSTPMLFQVAVPYHGILSNCNTVSEK